MHRDLFRLLVLLAVVRLLSATVIRDRRPPPPGGTRHCTTTPREDRLLRAARSCPPARPRPPRGTRVPASSPPEILPGRPAGDPPSLEAAGVCDRRVGTARLGAIVCECTVVASDAGGSESDRVSDLGRGSADDTPFCNANRHMSNWIRHNAFDFVKHHASTTSVHSVDRLRWL